MKRRTFCWLAGGGVANVVLLAGRLQCAGEEPSAPAVAGFDPYVGSVEARLAQQHRPDGAILTGLSDPQFVARLRSGQLVVEKLTSKNGPDLPGAMLHHWRATAFAPGFTSADLERVMRDYPDYPRIYAPQLVSARVLSQEGARQQVLLRVRQKHVVTVVMDMTFDVTFDRLDAQQGFSLSRSTRIAEIEGAGTPRERALSGAEEYGWLWRQNTYWSHAVRDGGLTMQVESVSLTRSIPAGMGWLIGPFVESVPRVSLEFTLRATRDALRT